MLGSAAYQPLTPKQRRGRRVLDRLPKSAVVVNPGRITHQEDRRLGPRHPFVSSR